MKWLTFFLIFFLSAACWHDRTLSNSKAQLDDQEAIFQKDKPFGLVEIIKDGKDTVSTEEKGNCKNWHLSKEDVSAVIISSETISKHEWHYLFDDLPCGMSGKLIQNDNEFDFEINAGSWVRISNKDTVLYFGNFDNEKEKLFLASPYNLDEEK